jgi:hypothetical protein
MHNSVIIYILKGPVLCMSTLEETVNDADFIFESVIEDLEVKADLMESMLVFLLIFY